MISARQWKLHENALTRAQETLGDFQQWLSLASYWGDGTTASSDGMRVPIDVSSLKQFLTRILYRTRQIVEEQ